MSKLGEYLKNLRKQRGYSLREAQDLLGVSRTFICDLEMVRHSLLEIKKAKRQI